MDKEAVMRAEDPHMERKKRLMGVMQQIHAAHGGLIAEHQMSEAPHIEGEDMLLSDEADGEDSAEPSQPEGSDEHGDEMEKRKERLASVMKAHR